MAVKYQTLPDFVRRPFGRNADSSKDQTYDKKYREYVKDTRIRIKAITNIGDSYYFHLKIPSESHKDRDYSYDVVIRFFTDDPVAINQPNLINYYIQFFSNSPSFIYQYAYVYKKKGYLIEELFNKLDSEYEDKPPKKTNPNQVVSYDKSIYFAVRFLYEQRFRVLVKRGYVSFRSVRPDKFFRDIADFQAVKFDQTIIAEEKRLQKELEKDSSVGVKSKTVISGKKEHKVNTNRNAATASITVVKKKNGKSKIVTKKRPTRSTTRKT